MNMIQNAKTQVLELTLQAYNKAADAGLLPAGCPVQPSVEIPKDTANGDYTTTFCLAAAKALKKNPRELAQLLLDNMELSGSYFTSAAMAGPGFLNFTLGTRWFGETVRAVQQAGKAYGENDTLRGKKYMVEFVSANPTGPMHMGNARGGALGDCLAAVLEWAGYDVTRLGNGKKLVLITGHRRENFGDGFIRMVTAMKDLSEKYPDVDFVYPMHLNPNVRKPIHEVFGDDLTRRNFFFIEPLQYLEFVYLMEKSTIVLTDSGGIQEEAPGLGKPVLVMRDTTERPEALASGTVHLVGTDYDKIVTEVSTLLDDAAAYAAMSQAVNPYGDGNACPRIADALR